MLVFCMSWREWDKKSKKGFLVGYIVDKDGYKIYMKEKDQIILYRDVIFKGKS